MDNLTKTDPAFSRLTMEMHAGPLPADHQFKNKMLACEKCGKPVYNPINGSLCQWGILAGRVLDADCIAGNDNPATRIGAFS